MLCVRTYNAYVAKREKTSETTTVVVYIYIKVIRTSFRVPIMIFHYIILSPAATTVAEWSPPLAIKFKFDPSPPLSRNTVTTHVRRI